jgi:serine protease Do
MAAHVEPALIAHGKVERGWLGVSIQDVAPDMAASIGMPQRTGVLIADVIQGGPAAKAGLKKGDVVLSYDGQPVQDSASLRNEVADTPVGQEVHVAVWRNRARQDLALRVANSDDAAKLMSAKLEDRLGIAVRPVTAKEESKFGLEPDQGVAVSQIKPDSPLAKAGLESADFILQINGSDVKGVEGFDRMVESLPEHQQAVILAMDHRTGQTGYLQVDLG